MIESDLESIDEHANLPGSRMKFIIDSFVSFTELDVIGDMPEDPSEKLLYNRKFEAMLHAIAYTNLTALG